MENDWRKGAVLYQIYPRSFCDANGDGVGDLVGVTGKLDYIADLGVDGIWLSPFFSSPMVDNGYDVRDYCAVDPVFGTLADFDTLVEKAHALNLKVIIDQVYSHTSDEHAWFQNSKQSRDSEYADWYVWADARADGSPPNNWQCWFGATAWTWNSRRKQYFLHNFHPRMPDLNVRNPAVQQALLETARTWMDRGVDGFRLDACNFYIHDAELTDNPPKDDPTASSPAEMQQHIHNICQPETINFLEDFRKTLDAYEERLAVAEIASEDDMTRMAEYTAGETRLHTAYSFHFLRSSNSPSFFRNSLIELYGANATAWPSFAFSNHDRPRVATRWGGETPHPRMLKTCIALLTSLRGNAFLYQGEELGLPQADVPFEKLQDPAAFVGWPHYKGRDGCRTPMPWKGDAPYFDFSRIEPWLPCPDTHRALAVDQQQNDPSSALHFVQDFLKWRKSHAALLYGDMMFLDAPGAGDIHLFTRSYSAEMLVCAFNLTDKTASVSLDLLYKGYKDAAPTEGWRVENEILALDQYGSALLEVSA